VRHDTTHPQDHSEQSNVLARYGQVARGRARRVGRRLLDALTVACVAAIVVLLILWPLSFRRYVLIMRAGHSSIVNVQVFQGRVFVLNQHGPGTAANLASNNISAGAGFLENNRARRLYNNESLQTLRFDWSFQKMMGKGGSIDSRFVCVPAWALIWLAAVVPTVRLSRYLRRRRRRIHGLCRSCGYDVRATPERCPECGTEWPLEGTQISPSSPST